MTPQRLPIPVHWTKSGISVSRPRSCAHARQLLYVGLGATTHVGIPPVARLRRHFYESATRSTGLRIGRQDPPAKAALHNEELHPAEVHGERRTLRFAVEPSAVQRYRIVSVKKTGSAP